MKSPELPKYLQINIIFNNKLAHVIVLHILHYYYNL